MKIGSETAATDLAHFGQNGQSKILYWWVLFEQTLMFMKGEAKLLHFHRISPFFFAPELNQIIADISIGQK